MLKTVLTMRLQNWKLIFYDASTNFPTWFKYAV